MSKENQAEAYIEEARLTLESARAIFRTAEANDEALWAQVVKNGYDAIEQAVSAAIASRNEPIPRRHPEKINAFIDLLQPEEALETELLEWLDRRSSSQYVDVRGDELNVPHEQFGRQDAETVLEVAERVLEYVSERL